MCSKVLRLFSSTPQISPPDQEHDPNLRSKSSDPPHWHHHDRVSPAAIPGSTSGVPNQWHHQNDSSNELLYKGRPVYCGSCKVRIVVYT